MGGSRSAARADRASRVSPHRRVAHDRGGLQREGALGRDGSCEHRNRVQPVWEVDARRRDRGRSAASGVPRRLATLPTRSTRPTVRPFDRSTARVAASRRPLQSCSPCPWRSSCSSLGAVAREGRGRPQLSGHEPDRSRSPATASASASNGRAHHGGIRVREGAALVRATALAR